MKLFFKSKDGGEDSNVTGYWLIEWKEVFSIVLLRFDRGSREAFHNHAFNAVSWVLRGRLFEVLKYHHKVVRLPASLIPVFTSKSRMHKVHGMADKTWVLSFRGPWDDQWQEHYNNTTTTLSSGRVVVKEEPDGRQ